MTCYKTEIQLNDSQKQLYWKTVGTCRFVYNLYLDKEKEYYEKEKKFLTAYSFKKWLNNDFCKKEENKWIKEVSSKAIAEVIMNAEKAYKKFFKNKKGFPRYKNRHNNNCSFYFVKTDAKVKIKCERHKIKIPTLGWVQLREFGYIPVTGKDIISSGSITYKADKYFISVITRGYKPLKQIEPKSEGIGIDLGIKDLAIISTIVVIPNPSKTKSGKRKLKRIAKSNKNLSKKKKGSKNRDIAKSKLQKAYQEYSFYKKDYIDKAVFTVVRTNPQYITVEDLNVAGMRRNRKLSKAFQLASLSQFKSSLLAKAKQYSIEVREVDRFFPSSQLCSKCGAIHDMPLKERIYRCNCGNVLDRDINSALNLKQAEVFCILPKAFGKVTPVEC